MLEKQVMGGRLATWRYSYTRLFRSVGLIQASYERNVRKAKVSRSLFSRNIIRTATFYKKIYVK